MLHLAVVDNNQHLNCLVNFIQFISIQLIQQLAASLPSVFLQLDQSRLRGGVFSELCAFAAA